MKGLKNKIARGLIFGSLILLPSFGFSQEKINPINTYSSVSSESMNKFPGYWQGFARKELPNNMRLELSADYMNIPYANQKNLYKFDIHNNLQQKFMLGNSDFYFGGGVVFSGSPMDKMNFRPEFVVGADINLKENSLIYFQSSVPIGKQPFFNLGFIKRF